MWNSHSSPAALTIVQESIKGKLFNNRKFDLQIYVLIARVDPLASWVSREGITRACCLKKHRFTQMEKTARDFQE
jgi:hypothetical protein